MTKRVLVTGGSISGLSAAFWLARDGWEVTLLERAARFRDGGQNVDVRGTAREVITHMGLDQQVRDNSTTEEGTSFVDRNGRVLGSFPVEDDEDGPTAELEILRGDLARVILDALPDGVQTRFGATVTSVEGFEDHVDVRIGDGELERFDLLVIAEGVRSSTRDLVFGGAAERHPIGLQMVYGTIPRTADDDRYWRWYPTTGRRQATLRPDDKGTTRATLAYVTEDDALVGLDRAELTASLRRTFAGAGWETERILDGFAGSDDVYPDYLTQMKLATWSKGRICVTGDAAWSVTPLGGGGASLALIGSYVLTAHLSRGGHEAIPAAFREYEAWMRPLIETTQKLPPGAPKAFYPKSAFGIGVLQTLVRVVSTGPARKLFAKLSHVARSERPLPAREGGTVSG